ncbi:MAG: Asp-tRNA(Asn)/Glu-tRNA(Gln) amidotransferase subunit GatC [Lachnospiraceae bacterium]|nr:Asp-tRNA(Asn)/Glu-tRNA(Gln) amidotransferase subunit GatC [Lachnospiraceae bacterium]
MNHLGTIELTTKRLTLRPFEAEDAASIFYNWGNDPKVTAYLTWKPYTSLEQVEAYIQENWLSNYGKKYFYQWAIELNELEQPIGCISAVDINEQTESVELGFCIGREFWQKGYTTEAVAEVMRFFLSQVGAGRVSAACDARNLYSAKAMKAAGMEYEGTLRQAIWTNQGIGDMDVYAKIRTVDLGEEAQEPKEQQAASVTRVLGEDGVMRSHISDETMEYVGILAKLELTPQETEAARRDMEEMLDYIDQLNELDTAGIEPMSHIFPVENVFREDVVINADGAEDTLRNAPLKKNSGFQVPKTIGE